MITCIALLSSFVVLSGCEDLFNKYTVTFNSNGGSDVEPQTVTSGDKATKPADPTRSGFTFDAWYKEAAFTNEWKFDTDVVTAYITLHAKWTQNTYTVTFNSNGGSAVQSQTVNEGGKATKPTDPTRSGYTFDKWYKEAALTNEWNFNTDVVIANVALYAKWIQNTYTVTFNSNGGSAVASQTINEGGKATKPTDPTRSGYTFDAWYKETALTNEWKFDTDVVTADITLHAKWIDAKQYDIGVVINGVKWATRNLAAHGEFVDNPEDYGALFQWGRKGDGHEQRTSQNYPTNDESEENGVVSGTSNLDSNGQIVSSHSAYGKFIKQSSSPWDWRSPQNDALWNSGTESAPIKTPNDPCPHGWRMPTEAELQSLVNAGSVWTTEIGVTGRRFGSGTNTLFLPAAGYRGNYYGTVHDVGTYGHYWSSTVDGTLARFLSFASSGRVFAADNLDRAFGFSCRCVAE